MAVLRLSRRFRPIVVLAVLLGLGLATPRPAEAQTGSSATASQEWQIANVGRGKQLPLYRTPGPILPTGSFVQDGDRVLNMGCMSALNDNWCLVQKATGDRANGFVLQRNLERVPEKPPLSSVQYLEVHGLKRGDRLNIRSGPSGNAPALASLREGERVRNLGCQTVGDLTWCRVRTIERVEVTGWANAAYLRPGEGRPPSEDDLTGGPDTWEVAGLRGSAVLPMHESAAQASRILISLINGDRLRNLGCRMVGQMRWCRVTYAEGVNVTGWVDGRYLKEAAPPAPPAPRPPEPSDEPNYWAVSGLRQGDTLNIRDAPSTSGRIIATARQGERLRNLGCTDGARGRWCQIRTTTGRIVSGYVSARYLVPSR